MSITMNEYAGLDAHFGGIAGVGSDTAISTTRADEGLRPVRTRRRALAPSDTRGPANGSFDYGSVGLRVLPRLDDEDVRSEQYGFGTVIATMLLTAIAVVGLLGLWNLRTGGLESVPSTTAVVHVQSGETLSDVAARVSPDAPVAEVVEQILRLNDMKSAGVAPGQALIAPVAP